MQECRQPGNRLSDAKTGNSSWSAPEPLENPGQEPENLGPGLDLGLRFSAPHPPGPSLGTGGEAPWARAAWQVIKQLFQPLPLPPGSMSTLWLPCLLCSPVGPELLALHWLWPCRLCPLQDPQAWAETQSQYYIPGLVLTRP